MQCWCSFHRSVEIVKGFSVFGELGAIMGCMLKIHSCLLRISWKHKAGIYSLNHSNGIRSVSFFPRSLYKNAFLFLSLKTSCCICKLLVNLCEHHDYKLKARLSCLKSETLGWKLGGGILFPNLPLLLFFYGYP